MRSHPYPILEAAEKEIAEAQAQYQHQLDRHFPAGTKVRVNHSRGSFYAKVVYTNARNCSITVENLRTGKRTYAYPSLRNGIHDTDEPCVVRLEN